MVRAGRRRHSLALPKGRQSKLLQWDRTLTIRCRCWQLMVLGTWKWWEPIGTKSIHHKNNSQGAIVDMNFQQTLVRKQADVSLVTKKSEKKETAQNTSEERLKFRRQGRTQGSCLIKSQSHRGLRLRSWEWNTGLKTGTNCRSVLQEYGKLLPTNCFCTASYLRIVFTF